MCQQYYHKLNKSGITPNQHYILHCQKFRIAQTLLSIESVRKEITLLQSLGLLNSSLIITQQGEQIVTSLEELFRKTKPKDGVDNLGADYLTKIKEYRELFPANKKSSTSEIVNKFSKLLNKQPDITWNDVIEATKLYLSEQQDDKYRMKAGNFIMVQRGGNDIYTLSEFIERIRDGEKEQEKTSFIKYG